MDRISSAFSLQRYVVAITLAYCGMLALPAHAEDKWTQATFVFEMISITTPTLRAALETLQPETDADLAAFLDRHGIVPAFRLEREVYDGAHLHETTRMSDTEIRLDLKAEVAEHNPEQWSLELHVTRTEWIRVPGVDTPRKRVEATETVVLIEPGRLREIGGFATDREAGRMYLAIQSPPEDGS
jgi:hypothetical protein